VRAACPGAGIFLTAEYANLRCGFSALGAVGKPAEAVAEEAVQAVLRHRASGAALDLHLGDQLLLPLALTEGPSRFTVEQVTLHLETNAWVIESFELARIRIETEASGIGRVTVSPVGTARGPALRPLTETYRGPQSGLRNG
jgi:RNA 3'-terminal phosphate cyclase (ATP)